MMKEPTDAMVDAGCKANMHPLAEPSDTERRHMRKSLKAALAAAPSTAPGWVLVPRVPTEDMLTAWRVGRMSGEHPLTIWGAMLAAAPSPPNGGQTK